MIKQLISISAALLLTASSAFAFDPVILDETNTLRLRGMIHPDVGAGDRIGVNLELGMGVTAYSVDQLGLFVGHMDAKSLDMTTLGGYVDESFDIGMPFHPIVGAKAGYGWTSPKQGDDLDSMILGLTFGVGVPLNSRATVTAYVDFLWADQNIYPDGSNFDDKATMFGLGFTFHY